MRFTHKLAVLLLWLGINIIAATTAAPGATEGMLNSSLIDELLLQALPGQTVVYLGDMSFKVSYLRDLRASLEKKKKNGASIASASLVGISQWPKGEVPYLFNSNVNPAQRAQWEAACREWEKYANVKFVERKKNEPNYVRVNSHLSLNNSAIGMQGGVQDINIADWNLKFVICHEIAHALGFVHEQNRSDRDDYVTIQSSNIKPGEEHNFAKLNTVNRTPYDFDSVMHYGRISFSWNNHDETIVPKPAYASAAANMGKQDHLSYYDKLGMVQMYGGPNLAFYQPSGWPDKIVVSTVTGTRSDDAPLYNNNTLYVDFAVINNGASAAGSGWSAACYVDGALVGTRTISDAINSGGTGAVSDGAIGPLAAGTHGVKVVLNTNHEIAETSEGDNVWEKTITVSSTGGAPTVMTAEAISVTKNYALAGGYISSDGGYAVAERGVVYSTVPNNTYIGLGVKCVSLGNLTGAFASKGFVNDLFNLVPNITYYVRAYAVNSAGVGYGSAVSFTTLAATNPDDHGNSMSAATSVSSNSTTAGNIETAGDNDYFRINVTGPGVLVVKTTGSTDTYGYLLDAAGAELTRDDESGGSSNFQTTWPVVAGTYYARVRHYASSGTGAYQLVVSFISTALPTVTNGFAGSSLEALSASSIFASGNVTSAGGSTVTERGVVYATTPNPTTASSGKLAYGSGTGVFTYLITGLNPGTTYYARAYAINGGGTAYSLQYTFTTLAATVDDHGNSIGTATLISQNSTTSGNIEQPGDNDYFRIDVSGPGSLVAKTTGSTDTFGYLLDAAGADLASDNDSGGSGNFQITWTVAEGTYYLRVRHSNPSGTGVYQLAASFVSAALPTVTTTNAGGIASNSADTGGNVTGSGGYTVTERGVVYSTTQNPTTASGARVISGSGTGGFTSSLTGLIPSTTYYVRAYAINSAGTAYGAQITFTTLVPFGDDHGNSIGTATLVSQNSTTFGNINTVGDSDYFRINVTSPGTLVVKTTGFTDTYGRLWDSSGTELTRDDDSGGSYNFQITWAVEAKAYYVQVYNPWSWGTGAYQLVVSFIPTSSIFSLAPQKERASSAGGSYSFNVTASGNWSWSQSAGSSWMTTSEAVSQNGNQTFSYTLAANPGAAARGAAITVTNGDFVLTYLVSQAGTARSSTVVAWGDNAYGRTNVPEGLNGVTAVSAGYSHVVALKSDGTVVAWGSSAYGMSTVPAGLGDAIAVSAGGDFTVALKSDGTVVTWGVNDYRQREVPLGLSGVTAIAAGAYHTAALKSDGTVVTWGDGTKWDNVAVGLTGVTAIASGAWHSVALKKDGTVVELDAHGGGGVYVKEGLSGVTAIAAGYDYTVALKKDGTVVAWGYNDGHRQVVPAGLKGVIAIAAGSYHTVALKKDGTVVAWGDNEFGQTTVPVGLKGVTGIAARGSYTVALVPGFSSLTLSRQVPGAVAGTPDKAGTVTLKAVPATAVSKLANGTSSVLPGTLVTLTATPKAGYLFSHWDGLPAEAQEAGTSVSFNMPVSPLSGATAVFIENPLLAAPFSALGANLLFQGLLTTEEEALEGNAGVGLFDATVTASSGSLSGKVSIDGQVTAYAGILRGDGSVWFKSGANIKRRLPLPNGQVAGKSLTANWSSSGLQAAVTSPAGVSSGLAQLPLYSKTHPIPPGTGLMDSKGKQGYFTLAIAPPPAAPEDAAAYPQGAGYSGLTLTNNGVLKIAGALPDGATITASHFLTTGDRSTVFVQLPTPGGKTKYSSFSGVLHFDSTQPDSDVRGEGLKWFRAVAETKPTVAQNYRAGWPDGMALGAAGALYDGTLTVQSSLGLGAVSPEGNAFLEFTDGNLHGSIKALNINGSKVEKLNAGDISFTLVFTPKTGLFKGTFTPGWFYPGKILPVFQGILLQKGAGKGGSGYFLGSDSTTPLSPESGAVHIH